MASLALLFAPIAVPLANAQQCGDSYETKEGDDLYSIAASAYGDERKWSAIYYTNQPILGSDPGNVAANVSLRIPCLDNETTADPTPYQRLDADMKMLTGGDYAPFTDQDLPGGGLITELVNAAIEKSPSPVTFSLTWEDDWSKHLSPLVQNRVFDLGFPWFQPNCQENKDDFRCATFHFSETLMEMLIQLYYNVDNPIEYTSDGDIEGKTLCRPVGYFTHDLDRGERRWLKDGKIELVQPDTIDECFSMLVAKEIDGVTINEFTGRLKIEELGLRGKVAATAKPLAIEGLHVVVSKAHPRGTAFMYRFNAGLTELKKSARYGEIIDRHLSNYWAQVEATETQSDSSGQDSSEAEPTTESETETETESESESEPMTEEGSESATDTESEPMQDVDSEAATDMETEPMNDVDSEAATDPETEPMNEVDSEAATDPETEPMSETDSDTAAETDTESMKEEEEAPSATDDQSDADTESKSEARAENGTGIDALSEADTARVDDAAIGDDSSKEAEANAQVPLSAEGDGAANESVLIGVGIGDDSPMDSEVDNNNVADHVAEESDALTADAEEGKSVSSESLTASTETSDVDETPVDDETVTDTADQDRLDDSTMTGIGPPATESSESALSESMASDVATDAVDSQTPEPKMDDAPFDSTIVFDTTGTSPEDVNDQEPNAADVIAKAKVSSEEEKSDNSSLTNEAQPVATDDNAAPIESQPTSGSTNVQQTPPTTTAISTPAREDANSKEAAEAKKEKPKSTTCKALPYFCRMFGLDQPDEEAN